MNTFGFDKALQLIREGKRVTRKDWEGKYSVVLDRYGDSMNLLDGLTGVRGVHWVRMPTSDTLATDWHVVEPVPEPPQPPGVTDDILERWATGHGWAPTTNDATTAYILKLLDRIEALETEEKPPVAKPGSFDADQETKP